MKQNQKIVLYMNDDVSCGEFTSIVEAYKALQECKRQDKEEHLQVDCYYFVLEEETDEALYYTDVKIYRRKNKLFMRPYERQY